MDSPQGIDAMALADSHVHARACAVTQAERAQQSTQNTQTVRPFLYEWTHKPYTVKAKICESTLEEKYLLT